MINHQTAVLDYFDPGCCQHLGKRIVPDARLQPDSLRFFREYVVQVRVNILRATKDVDQVDLDGYLDQLAVDLLPKDMGHVRVVDRDRNDLKAGGLKIAGNVKGWLVRLRLSFDPKHGNCCRRGKQLSDLLSAGDEVFLPGHKEKCTRE